MPARLGACVEADAAGVAQEWFAQDLAAAWTAVMIADRYDLTA